MHTTRFLAAAGTAALILLAGCNREPETVTAGPPDTQAADLAKAKPVALPPSIVASKAYRCKDNSIVYIDFMSDQTTANYRTSKAGEPTVLTASAAGKPFTAPGYSVSGSGSTITLTTPKKGTQTCDA